MLAWSVGMICCLEKQKGFINFFYNILDKFLHLQLCCKDQKHPNRIYWESPPPSYASFTACRCRCWPLPGMLICIRVLGSGMDWITFLSYLASRQCSFPPGKAPIFP